MKKKYIIPALNIVGIEADRHLLADSYAVSSKTVNDDKGGWVKRDRSSYSVWDEDWSN